MSVIDADAHVHECDRTWDFIPESDREFKPFVVSGTEAVMTAVRPSRMAPMCLTMSCSASSVTRSLRRVAIAFASAAR